MDKHKLKIYQKEIGIRLAKARQECNMTQSQVASTGILKQSHLSKIESGEILVNIFTLQELAKLYNVSLLKLINNEEK